MWRSILAGLLVAAVAIPTGLVGGRTVSREGFLWFGWPGVYFQTRLKGTGLSIRLDAPDDNFRVLVDDKLHRLVRKPAGKISITGLRSGMHMVRVERLTENQQQSARFGGFLAGPGATLLPVTPLSNQIEFIGDSYTVGYGNISPTTVCSAEQVHDRTNTSRAFSVLTAKSLTADYRIIALSGYGVVRNTGGIHPGDNMPARYPRVLPSAAGATASDPGWNPDWIVIYLGINDFSTPLQPGEKWASLAALMKDYQESYLRFARTVHARYPAAQFLLIASPAFAAPLQRVATTLRAENIAVAVLDSPPVMGTACQNHPGLQDHASLAKAVVAAIRQKR